MQTIQFEELIMIVPYYQYNKKIAFPPAGNTGRAGGDEDGTYLRQAFWERELGGEQYIYKNYRKNSLFQSIYTTFVLRSQAYNICAWPVFVNTSNLFHINSLA